MSKIKSSVHSSDSFWNAFHSDLDDAKCRVLIKSPFISLRQISSLSYKFNALIERGVTICVFAQDQSTWKTTEKERIKTRDEIKEKKELLSRMRIHVTFIPLIHEKLAIIDDSILWEGSLNILSHLNTKERMRRIANEREVKAAIGAHSMDRCSDCCDNYSSYGNSEARSMMRKLRERRLLKRIRQSELAQKCGLTQSWLSRIENESDDMSLKALNLLACELELELVLVPRLILPTVLRIMRETDSSEEPPREGRR